MRLETSVCSRLREEFNETRPDISIQDPMSVCTCKPEFPSPIQAERPQ